MRYLIVALMLTTTPVFAEEKVSLNKAFDPDPRTISEFRVGLLRLDWANEEVQVGLTPVGASNIVKMVTYYGDEAKTLMRALNKANLSVNSLHKRTLTKLINDGHIAGAISGTPE